MKFKFPLNKFHYLSFFFLFSLLSVTAQENEDIENKLDYHIERQLVFGSGNNPLWFNANKYGLSSINPNNGYLRLGINGIQRLGETEKWTLDYGADAAAAYNFTSTIIIQQLYAGIKYKKIGFCLGSKERPANMKNAELSSGSQTFGINARPIPDIRIEIPEYTPLLRNKNWLSFKFHLGYGITTDQNWQKQFAAQGTRYNSRFFCHTKSAFFKIGDEDLFPIIAEGGFESATQFGGTSYNTYNLLSRNVKCSSSLKDFFYALYGGGSDPTDVYKNALGNTLGSWLFSLSYKLGEARARIYLDHFFEDHSQLFFQYGWRDGLYGCEFTFPKNPFIGSFVYEYIRTDDQSGAVYHDANSTLPDQISAVDNYYNHLIYTGWQHWGQAIGNPLFTSPLYNKDHNIYFHNNRFRGHHFGINGNPLRSIHYRLLYTYSENWGTYEIPFDDKKYDTSFLGEVTFSLKHLGHWNISGNSIRCAFAFDRGHLMGNNTGFQIGFISNGLFKM